MNLLSHEHGPSIASSSLIHNRQFAQCFCAFYYQTFIYLGFFGIQLCILSILTKMLETLNEHDTVIKAVITLAPYNYLNLATLFEEALC